ncbi:monocarboxylate transporter 10-like [Limulus polyphemus]|uniref:Monocarboxylate transporter 10-like n=1 Tax=Limulus polyphemus TaxID=6850 RepID=A0ABM1B545_LIMPO|nr:monocarboxylate transporter 10-like [Limulus polyphemus]
MDEEQKQGNVKARMENRKFRSKSVASMDPRSPYFTSSGLNRAPSVACVMGCSGRLPNKQSSRQSVSYLGLATHAADLWEQDDVPEGNGQIPGLNLYLSPDDPKAVTIRQHYYPEGGWGWVVCGCAIVIQALSIGLLFSYGIFLYQIRKQFDPDVNTLAAVCLGALSTGVALLLSPVVVAICRKKSTRLIAIIGGLVTALGYLFTSFTTQFHQLFLSYGIVISCGVSLTRDATTLMVGQYFKRRRSLVEIMVSCGTGLGIMVMPIVLSESIRTIGWRLGLQAITGIVFMCFLLAIFYRPASLYHPQRRAILHLKSLQKRSRAKDKKTLVEKPHFFDFGVLKSRTVQILIFGTSLTAFGVHTPIILLTYQGKTEGLDYQLLLLLQVYLGLAFILGSGAFGLIVVKKSMQCMIAPQYLCQASSFMISVSLVAFTALQHYYGYVLFVWVYGIFYGGYCYSLKMYIFDKVRARNFAKAWGFLQCCQAIPHFVGIPLTGYLNELYDGKTGFYFSAAFTFIGSMSLFLIDLHKRRTKKGKMSVLSHARRRSDACMSRTFSRRSLSQDSVYGRNPPLTRLQQRSMTVSNYTDLRRQELTCISEEAMLDNIWEDFVDECITSCNKEEKYLVLSEYEQNLNKTQESADHDKTGRTRRKSSLVSSPTLDRCPKCRRFVSASIDGATNQDQSHHSGSLGLRQLPTPVGSVDVSQEATSSL